MLTAASILQLHDTYNRAAHAAEKLPELPDAPENALRGLVLCQHVANFDLWHEEDKARTPDPAPALIVEVKHNIDRLNQQRNDLVERIDMLLLETAGEQNAAAPLNSETPGLIIDRLSILSLKLYHTSEEALRTSASEEHRARSQARLTVLSQQRDDLAGCLDELWTDILAQRRRFKLYRQLKMYNDPELNPVLYESRVRRQS